MAEAERLPDGDEQERRAIASRGNAAHALEAGYVDRSLTLVALAQVDATLALVARLREHAVTQDYIVSAIDRASPRG